jgi:hypothetical protein
MRKTGFRDTFFTLVFISIMALPIIHWIVPLIPQYQLHENRKLAGPPHFANVISNLPETINASHKYFQDRFGMRTMLIHYYNSLNLWLFGRHTQVLIGRNGWLFLSQGVHVGVENPTPIIHDLCGYAGFAEMDLERWAAALIGNWKRLRSQGIAYYLVVAPNKHSVYSEHINLPANCVNRQTRLRTLKKRLLQAQGFPWIELTEPLRKHASSKSKNLYHLTDTHWNAFGQLTVYAALVDVLNKKLPLVSAHASFSVTGAPNYLGDLAVMLQSNTHPGGGFSETGYRLKMKNITAKKTAVLELGSLYRAIQKPATWQSGNKNGIHALIFHDSFFYDEMQQLLAETFEKTTFVAATFPNIAQPPIDIVQPDVVIQEMVERRLLIPVRLQ